MQKSFTLEDLAQYSREVYLETQKNVNKVIKKTGPSALVIRNILNYSKALKVSDPGSGKPVFLVMN